MNPYLFLNIRLILTILIFIISIFLHKYGFILAPILSYIFYKGITYTLIDNKLKKRNLDIEKEAINFFEILTLSLETGRNLLDALNTTTESCDGILCNEFIEALREVEYGKNLTEALKNATSRIPSDAINNIILILTEANIYGNSIINSLTAQIEYLREKRKQEIKGEISKLPIKISIISVLFFIPLMLLIVLGPALLNYINS